MANNLARGAVFLLLGELCLAIMAAMIKHLAEQTSHETIVFARNLFGFIAVIPIALRFGIADLATQVFPMHLLRAVTGLTAMYGYFYVIANMPLAEAVLVKLSAPFFLPIIAFLWLKEKINHLTIWSIVIGFVGVIFVLRPGSETFQPVALLGIGAAVLASFAKVCIRRMASTEPSHRIVFYFGLLATLISAVPAIINWQPPLSVNTWLWLAGVGIAGTCGQLLMTQAYIIAKPGQVGPYTYSSVVYASIMGWIFWQEILVWTTIIGCSLIIGAGILNMKKANS
ncbi:MAG: DMT family transporter [Pseudomonadales bacterium]|nr:DMT family transporter [Pseudomonadales bacterium]